jgi:hypothetical protein
MVSSLSVRLLASRFPFYFVTENGFAVTRALDARQTCHARLYAGHPRLESCNKEGVDGRTKSGHDVTL